VKEQRSGVRLLRHLKAARRSAAKSAAERRATLDLHPVDQVRALLTNKTGPQGGLAGKRSRRLRMSESHMLLQLDPLDHHFDPEAPVPTLWISAN
jgi:hypothetical protein